LFGDDPTQGEVVVDVPVAGVALGIAVEVDEPTSPRGTVLVLAKKRLIRI